MTARTLSCFLFPILLVSAATAQRNCATLDHWEYVLSKHVNTAQNRALIERHTQLFIQTPQLRDGNNILIPVVVNILYNNPNENISDEQIEEQIRVLNEDYRRKTGTRGYNTNTVGADTGIEFYLATIDPDGKATTGITRHYYAQKTTFDVFLDDQTLANIVSWNIGFISIRNAFMKRCP
jgi:hypothetical protein